MTPRLVFVGTATINGIVAASHAASLVALTQRLNAAGTRVLYRSIDGPKIAMQRDLLADEFLRSEATHLLLLDGDLIFAPDLALRLLALDVPLAGAAYALSGPDLREVARLHPTHGLDRSLAQAAPWNLKPLPGGLRVAGGRARVAAVGAGCLLVSRTCLQEIEAGLRRYPPVPGGREIAAFFRGLPHEPQDLVLHDRLCRLWTAQGGEVWLDVEAEVARVSTFRFGAPFSEYLRAIGPGRDQPATRPQASAP